MPTGDLRYQSIDDVLRWIDAAGASGALEIGRGGKGALTIYFHSGRLTFADQGNQPPAVSEIEDAGIDRKMWERALSRPEARSSVSASLLAEGVPREAVETFALRRITLAVQGLRKLWAGRFHTTDAIHPFGTAASIEASRVYRSPKVGNGDTRFDAIMALSPTDRFQVILNGRDWTALAELLAPFRYTDLVARIGREAADHLFATLQRAELAQILPADLSAAPDALQAADESHHLVSEPAERSEAGVPAEEQSGQAEFAVGTPVSDAEAVEQELFEPIEFEPTVADPEPETAEGERGVGEEESEPFSVEAKPAIEPEGLPSEPFEVEAAVAPEAGSTVSASEPVGGEPGTEELIDPPIAAFAEEAVAPGDLDDVPVLFDDVEAPGIGDAQDESREHGETFAVDLWDQDSIEPAVDSTAIWPDPTSGADSEHALAVGPAFEADPLDDLGDAAHAQPSEVVDDTVEVDASGSEHSVIELASPIAAFFTAQAAAADELSFVDPNGMSGHLDDHSEDLLEAGVGFPFSVADTEETHPEAHVEPDTDGETEPATGDVEPAVAGPYELVELDSPELVESPGGDPSLERSLDEVAFDVGDTPVPEFEGELDELHAAHVSDTPELSTDQAVLPEPSGPAEDHDVISDAVEALAFDDEATPVDLSDLDAMLDHVLPFSQDLFDPPVQSEEAPGVEVIETSGETEMVVEPEGDQDDTVPIAEMTFGSFDEGSDGAEEGPEGEPGDDDRPSDEPVADLPTGSGEPVAVDEVEFHEPSLPAVAEHQSLRARISAVIHHDTEIGDDEPFHAVEPDDSYGEGAYRLVADLRKQMDVPEEAQISTLRRLITAITRL